MDFLPVAYQHGCIVAQRPDRFVTTAFSIPQQQQQPVRTNGTMIAVQRTATTMVTIIMIPLKLCMDHSIRNKFKIVGGNVRY